MTRVSPSASSTKVVEKFLVSRIFFIAFVKVTIGVTMRRRNGEEMGNASSEAIIEAIAVVSKVQKSCPRISRMSPRMMSLPTFSPPRMMSTATGRFPLVNSSRMPGWLPT